MALKIILTTSIFIAILSLNACYYDNEEELYPDTGTCVTDSISYVNDIVPVLDNNCLSCHSASLQLGSVNLEGYNNLKIFVNNGSFLGSIQHANGYHPMPQSASKLPVCTILKIESWINDGAPNN
ncbi:MAG: hypothetical protein R2798_03910 [Chitinophagales bacterium]|nr:hypothetical protein [Bacteroidota bacterium]